MCATLINSDSSQSAFLKEKDKHLKDTGDGGLLTLLSTADGSDVQQASLHAQLRNDLVDAMMAVQEVRENGNVVQGMSSRPLGDSASTELQAAQTALGQARSKLLPLAASMQAKVLEGAERRFREKLVLMEPSCEIRYRNRVFRVCPALVLLLLPAATVCACSVHHLILMCGWSHQHLHAADNTARRPCHPAAAKSHHATACRADRIATRRRFDFQYARLCEDRRWADVCEHVEVCGQ